MTYIPDDWKLSDYVEYINKYGTVSATYPKPIIQKQLKQLLIDDLVEVFGIENTSKIVDIVKRRFEE